MSLQFFLSIRRQNTAWGFSKLHERSQAFTLTEIALVVGIVGIILAAIFWAASNLYLSNQVRTTNRQLTSIVQNIKTLYAEQGGIVSPVTAPTWGVVTPALDILNVFPAEMRFDPSTPSGTIFHVWSRFQYTPGPGEFGTLLVSGDDCTGTASMLSIMPCFKIMMSNLPTAACIQLIAGSPLTLNGLKAMYVYGNTSFPMITSFPVSISTASTECNSTSSNNTIIWIFLFRENQ